MSDPIQREAELLARIMLLEEKIDREQKPPLPKPAWQRFLESNGGTALVTVLISGIFGTAISQMIQNKQQEREQRMKLYTLNLNDQNKTTANSLELLGETLLAIKGLALSKGPDFAVDIDDTTSTNNIKIIFSQITQLREKFNSASDTWKSRRFSQGFLLSMYDGNYTKIERQWRLIANEMDMFMEYAVLMTGEEFNEQGKNEKLIQFESKIADMTVELIGVLRNQQTALWGELE